jgi:hypothetical protein
MEKGKTKQVRSISVDHEIYDKFKTICTVRGLIMSIQFEIMMQKFIEDYPEIIDVFYKPEKVKK